MLKVIPNVLKLSSKKLLLFNYILELLNQQHSSTSVSIVSHVSSCPNPQVLQNLGKDKFSPQSFEQVGTRIAKVLEKVRAPS